MKHVFFLALLLISLVVIYMALSGQLSNLGTARGDDARSAPPAVGVPVQTRQAPLPAGDPPADNAPADTVERVIQSGNNLGRHTRKAFEGVEFEGNP